MRLRNDDILRDGQQYNRHGFIMGGMRAAYAGHTAGEPRPTDVSRERARRYRLYLNLSSGNPLFPHPTALYTRSHGNSAAVIWSRPWPWPTIII